MPPPMPTSRGGPTRMTANPLKPVGRYRPGKPVADEQSDSEEDEEDEVQEEVVQPKQPSRPAASSFPAGRTGAGAKRAQVVQSEAISDEEGFVTEEDEEDDGQAAVSANGATVPLKSDGPTATTTTTEQFEEEEESEEETSEEETESSSDEEAPQRKLLRPTFIKKSNRNGKTETSTPAATVATPIPQPHTAISPTTSPAPPLAIDGLSEEEARRRAIADLMITDKLERDAIARAAGKKSWDDDEEVAPEDMVDDTDGVDPEAELAAWKLRELKRLKRDREAIEEREKEIEEVERRKNLTAEEREKEDKEYIENQKEERDSGRGKAGFLQRYHHKGAFFQDDEVAKEVLARRDLMGAKFVDEIKNREALPEYMQVRDMTKLGRKGRTRYKDLRNEDTGQWGDFGRSSPRKDGAGLPGPADERFRPDDDRRGDRGPTGANAGAIGERRPAKKVEGAPEGPRAMTHSKEDGDRVNSYRPRRKFPEDDDDDDADRHAHQDRMQRRRSYSYSRSRSPRRDRDRYRDHDDDRSRRKRSPSPYRDRDKRRRVEAS